MQKTGTTGKKTENLYIIKSQGEESLENVLDCESLMDVLGSTLHDLQNQLSPKLYGGLTVKLKLSWNCS